jgi:GxxExxY protein
MVWSDGSNPSAPPDRKVGPGNHGWGYKIFPVFGFPAYVASEHTSQPMTVADLLDEIESAASEVNDALNPENRESPFHKAMCVELSDRGVRHSTESRIPIYYKDTTISHTRPDLMVSDGDNTIIVELKARGSGVDQCQNYLDLADDADMDVDAGMAISFGYDLDVTRLE